MKPVLDKGCFNRKNRPGATDNKRLVKQVYRVKNGGRKEKGPDLTLNNQRPINHSEQSASDSRMVEKEAAQNLGAKPKRMLLKVNNTEGEVVLSKKEKRPIYSIDLSNWEKRKLEKLSAQELKRRDMAWVYTQSIYPIGRKGS